MESNEHDYASTCEVGCFKSKTFCSVPQCNNKMRSGLSFHKFPRNKVMLTKWVNVLKIGKAVSTYMCVCSEHFTREDFFYFGPTSKIRRLKKTSVPSCKLPLRKHDKIPTEKEQSRQAARSLRAAERRKTKEKSIQSSCEENCPGKGTSADCQGEGSSADCQGEGSSADCQGEGSSADCQGESTSADCQEAEMATQESVAYTGDDITTERDLFWAAIKEEVDVTVSNRTEYVGFESVRVKEEPGVEDEMWTVRDVPSGFDILLPPVEMVLVDAVAVKTEPIEGDDPLRLNSDACQWDVTTGTDPPQIPGHQKWEGDTSNSHCSNATAVRLEPEEQSLVNKRFECAVCNVGFENKPLLRRHVIAHDDGPIDEFEFVTCAKEEKNVVVWDSVNKNEAPIGPLPFACDVPACGKTFADGWHLRCHAYKHCAWQSFVCDACGKAFKGKSCLTRHKLTHADERPHACPVAACGKRFKHKHTLSTHELTHSDSRPFECAEPSCGKRYKSRNNLSVHELTHSESQPFECAEPSCGKGFRTIRNLTLHMQTHESRIYKCSVEECGKQYKKKAGLERHRDTHCGRSTRFTVLYVAK